MVTGVVTVGVVALLGFLALRLGRRGALFRPRVRRPWFVGHWLLPTRSQESRAGLAGRPSRCACPRPTRLARAGDGARTHDSHVGNVANPLPKPHTPPGSYRETP